MIVSRWIGLMGTLAVLGNCSGQRTPRKQQPDQAPTMARPRPPAQRRARPTTARRPSSRKVRLTAARAQVWRFDKEPLHKVPAGFTVLQGTWRVAAEPSSPAAGRVLSQVARSPGQVFNVTLVAGVSARDVDLLVKMRANAGTIDQGGGLVWRARDAKNYYVARFNPLEDNYRLYTVKDGVRKMLKSARVKLPARQWHTLRVTMQGDHIRCFINGRPLIEAHDRLFVGPGRIGLWTKADAQSDFDELTLRGAEGSRWHRMKGRAK